ncbi:MAG: hypothetical protein GPJ52_14800 [Candidatus Heimdallarchaeota archaeon]|nr:hypothetical protein [Candidatus Heimdallarchaeota archaeon]
MIPLGAASEDSAIFDSIASLVRCVIFTPLSGLVARFYWKKKSEVTIAKDAETLK